MKLLNPGPVTLSARVRAALQREDICHREPEFFDLQDDVRHRLLAVYGLDPSQWAVVLLTGSGTAALEAMISTLVPATGRLLVLDNGAYGERLFRIAQRHAIRVVYIKSQWGAALPLEEAARALGEASGITHIAAVHHETSSGRLNGLASLGELCRRYEVRLLIDGVSSFGAEDIAFDAWRLTACAATANKCLHGAPGISFVLVRRDALIAADAERTLYLDLKSYCRAQENRDTPFTPAVHVLYALAEALREHEESGGWRSRHRHYANLANRVTEGLRKHGIKRLLSAEESSAVLHAYRLPDGLSYAQLHDGVKKHGLVIYAGQGPFAEHIFRISTMGAITSEDVDRLIEAVRQTQDR